jgi:diguanylate cyclase (GGDEF)-like protein
VILSRAFGDAAPATRAVRLRTMVARLAGAGVDSVGGTPRVMVTVSIGVGVFPPADAATADQLVAAADRALYQAKAAGRNRVVVAHPTADPTES